MYRFDKALELYLIYFIGREVENISINQQNLYIDLHPQAINVCGSWALFDENDEKIDSRLMQDSVDFDVPKHSYHVFGLLRQKIKGIHVPHDKALSIKFDNGMRFEIYDDSMYECCFITPNIYI